MIKFGKKKIQTKSVVHLIIGVILYFVNKLLFMVYCVFLAYCTETIASFGGFKSNNQETKDKTENYIDKYF